VTASLQLIRKFQALTNRVDEILQKVSRSGVGQGRDRPWFNYDPLDVLSLYERWRTVREELVASEPELIELPAYEPPKPSGTTDNEGRGIIERPSIERMRSAMRDAWDILNHPSRQLPQVSIDREGVFVGGQPFDAMLAITSILRAATRSITVVDGYASERILNLLNVKVDIVAPRILTHPQRANPAFVELARAFNRQYAAGPQLEVRTTRAFHDRFVVVDDADYYHFGASIDGAANRNAFMFSRIEETDVVAAVSALITREWGAATVVAL